MSTIRTLSVLLLSGLFLAAAVPPVRAEEPEASGTPADGARLRAILEGMGYDAGDADDSGRWISLARDGWTFSIFVCVSQSERYVWVESYLGDVPKGATAPAAALFDLLAAHNGPMHYYVKDHGDHYSLWLGKVIPNRGIDAAHLREAIDEVASATREGEESWAAVRDAKAAPEK